MCVYIVHGGWDCVSKVEASYRWVRRVSGGLVASRDCFAGEKKVNEDGDVTYVSRISFIYVKYIYIYIYKYATHVLRKKARSTCSQKERTKRVTEL